MKLSNKQREEKNDFINSVNIKMQSAVNNGDVFKTAGTALTVSDVRNKVSVEEKMKTVESIKNGQDVLRYIFRYANDRILGLDPKTDPNRTAHSA